MSHHSSLVQSTQVEPRSQKTQYTHSRVPARCREELKMIRQYFPPPDRDVFRLLVSLGVGLELFSESFDKGCILELVSYFASESTVDLEVVDEILEWHLTASNVIDVESGTGVFWEILQSGLLLYNQLQELEPGTALYMQVMESSVNSLKCLSELSKRAFNELTTTYSFLERHIVDDLFYFGQFLVILTKCLEEDEVHDRVIGVLVELGESFHKTEPKSRAVIISLAFQLFDILLKRDMEPTPIIDWIKSILHGLLQELDSIQKWSKDHSSVAGDLPCGVPRNQDPSKYLQMMKEVDQELIELILIQIQRLMCVWMKQKDLTEIQRITVWFDVVPGFLSSALGLRPGVQVCALNLLLVGLNVIRKVVQIGVLVETLQYMSESMVKILEDYLHCYLPQRLGRLSVNSEVNFEVLELVVRILGEIQGLCLVHGLKTWTEISDYCRKPYSLLTFSEKANFLHRNFLYLYLTSVLRITLDHDSNSFDLKFCLYFWFRQILEPRWTTIGLGFTLVLNRVFQFVGMEDYMEWIEDKTGTGIQKLTQSLFQHLMGQQNGSEIALFLISKLNFVLEAREKELKEEEQIKYFTKASGVICTLIKLQYCPFVNSLDDTFHSLPLLDASFQQTLMHQYFIWVLKSLIHLQNSHSKDLNSTRNMVSPLVHLNEILDSFVSHFSTQGFEGNYKLTQIVQLIATCILKVPFTSTGANSIDLKTMESFVSALETKQEQSSILEEPRSTPLTNHTKKIHFLHFFLTTCFWSFVEKASNQSLFAERAVVNGLYFIKECISRTQFQSSSTLLRLVPCLLSPFAMILKSDSSREFSNSCKLPLLLVLSKFLVVCLELLPAPSLDCNHLEIKGSVQLRGGPLETSLAPDLETVQRGFGVLLTLALRSALSIVRSLLTDHILEEVDRTPSSNTCYKPITKKDAIDAQNSFSVLFGHCWRSSWNEQTSAFSMSVNRVLEGLNCARRETGEFETIAKQKLPEMVFIFLKNLANLSPLTARWTAPIIHPLGALFNTSKPCFTALNLIDLGYLGCPLISHLKTPFQQVEEAVRSSGVVLVKHELVYDKTKQEME